MTGSGVEVRSFPDRDFKIWDYSVSHRQMVIRGLGPAEGSPNVDLHFRGVAFMRIPAIFRGLSLVAATPEEIAEAQRSVELGRCDPETVHVLESAGHRYLVVAASLDVAETDHPMMSTALIHPGP